MSPTAIKDIDGLPQGEIRELVKDGDRAVMDALGGRIGSVETRMGAMESRLEKVEVLAQSAVDLSQKSVEQNEEILAKFELLQGQVLEVRKETADGVVVTEKLTRWGQTAHDLKIYDLARWALRLLVLWGASKLVGYFVGPQLRDEFFEVIKKVF